jgi:uncharacterized damage-inducible protein DinB
MTDDPLREQLARFLDWGEAHVDFDKSLAGIPPDKRGARAAAIEHSIWQLLEHMRIAQTDILNFCVNAKYVHDLKWPDDYWPTDPAPPSGDAWDQSVAAFRRDREALKQLAREATDLHALVPTGKGHQTFIRAILLVNDHNSYHLGQILVVRKALGIWG